MTDAVIEKMFDSDGSVIRTNKIALATWLALFAIAIVGVVLVVRFVESERQRDLQTWQVRLGIVADTRAAAVGAWVDTQYATLRDLAENASLQLYMTELIAGAAAGEPNPFEVSTLRTLLTFTAARGGFTVPAAALDIRANVEPAGLAGIALVDSRGAFVASTRGMPPLTPSMRDALRGAADGTPAMVDAYVGPSRQPTMAFVVPVYAVAGGTNRSSAIGFVIGVKMLGEAFYQTMDQPGDVTESAETYLVRSDGTTVEYLTPLGDGTRPMRRALARDTPELAASFVLDHPGGFALARDYRGEEVLVTGRALTFAPWHVIRTVTAEYALAESERRATMLLTIFLAIIAALCIAVAAVWRHASSVREAEASARYRHEAEKFRGLSRFLRVVTDGLPSPIAVLDAEGRYIFANGAAAAAAQLEPPELVGKSLRSVFGPVKAKVLERLNTEVINRQVRISELHEFDEPEGTRTISSDHIPFQATESRPGGALMRLDDITEVVEARRLRERTLEQLIDTLVDIVDRRDPHATHHSERVVTVAAALAGELGVADSERSTVVVAGRLMNLGKLMVPEQLLTKTAALTAVERDRLYTVYPVAAELLERVDFNGPVVETIRQIPERWDGAGPMRLKGEAIQHEARILTVANAFVSMISGRAYREPMSVDGALDILNDESSKMFDRRIVLALSHYVENRGGREAWAGFGVRSGVSSEQTEG